MGRGSFRDRLQRLGFHGCHRRGSVCEEKGLNDPSDPDGTYLYLFTKFRTNQLMSKLMRGAVQMGYNRRHIDPSNHMRDEQGDTPQMHPSCTFMLCQIIGVTSGYRMFVLLRPVSAGTTEHVLAVDPCSIVMFDLGIQMQAKFVEKSTAGRMNPQPRQ